MEEHVWSGGKILFVVEIGMELLRDLFNDVLEMVVLRKNTFSSISLLLREEIHPEPTTKTTTQSIINLMIATCSDRKVIFVHTFVRRL